MGTNAKNQSGHMLAMMLVVIFCSSILLHALLDGQLRSAQLINRDAKSTQAFYLAESAVGHSFSLLRKGSSGAIEATDLGVGHYQSQVETLPDNQGFKIIGKGIVNMPRGEVLTRQVEVVAVKAPEEGWMLTQRVE
ncbi:MAG TPA: hypothetical protein PKH07_11700 [bacterium]|nr:hypothetical protein [bacterium]